MEEIMRTLDLHFLQKFYTVFGISLWLIYVFSAPVLSNLVLLNFNIPIFDKFLISELLLGTALLSVSKKQFMLILLTLSQFYK